MSGYRSWLQKAAWLRLTGLILLGVLLWQLDIATLIQIVQGADWYLLIIAIILNLPMVLFKSLRWQILMHSQDIKYSVGKAYLAYFGSIFIGLLTPGRLGELVKAVHINQDCDVPVGKALSSVLVDRLFDLSALLLVGGTALLTLTPDYTEVTALTGFILLLILPLVLFLNNTTFGWLERVGFRLGFLGEKLFASGSWLQEMRLGLHQLTWSGLLIAIALTILAYTTFFGQSYLLALALKLPAGFVLISFAVALGSLVTLLPISISGLGTREVAIVTYLGTAGVPAEAALGFSLLIFLTFYLSAGLMGLAAWWLKPLPLSKMTTKADDLLHSTSGS